MCGIAAIFAYTSTARDVDRGQLARISNRIACRGPDGDGTWVTDDSRVALAHRRLAIIDLSDRGAQPMHSADGRYTITFNGEIYNYRALRARLEARGRRFRSGSDTEVLLHLYADKGDAMLQDLRGMFAFAIWDNEKRGLFMARDTFGIKPLYYSDDGGTLRVASEVKALLAGGGIDTNPEPAGHVGFFLWGWVPEPYTLYRGIRSLPAGHSMWISEGGERTMRPFSDVGDLLRTPESSIPAVQPLDADEVLREALLDSIRHHLVADVDVGVFLSAGLDSTTVAALAAEIGGRIKSVTLAFDEYRGTANDESPLAEAVAKSYGLDHQTMWVTRADFAAERERLLDRMDQPTVDGVNTYFVSRAVAQAGLKVALSGLGGDELFGGYPSFRQVPRLVALAGRVPGSRVLGRRIRAAVAPALGSLASPKFAGLLEYGGDYGGAYLLRRGLFLPWELESVLDPDIAREGWAELAPRAALEAMVSELPSNHAKVSALEARVYMRNQLLRDTDWASMTWSLEVRVPLVDPPLWRRTAALGDAGFRVSKRAMANAARPSLPETILDRAKTGFSIPVNSWVRNVDQPKARGLRGWAMEVYQSHVEGTR